MGKTFRRGLASSPTATPAIVGASPTATCRNLADQDHFKSDPLEGKLFPGTFQKLHRPFGRFGSGPEFDANGLFNKMREVFLHLTVENKGDIGIQFFLKLKKLPLAELPGTCLKHGQNQNILSCIMSEGIQHAGSFETGPDRGRIIVG